jgi:hypothetical protein
VSSSCAAVGRQLGNMGGSKRSTTSLLLSMITRTGAAAPALLASFVAPGADAALLLLFEDRHPPILHTTFN